MKPRLQRWLRALAWAVAAPGVAWLCVRAFVGDVYYVDSRSMAPTLHGGAADGEYVFVEFGRSRALERFDLVVLQRPGELEPLVKRVAALGGETVQVAGGDLLIEGELLPPNTPRPPWVLLFDSKREDIASFFSVARQPAMWSRAADGLRLDAGETRSVAAELIPRALDDYFDAAGQRVGGRRQAPDLALEVDVRFERPGGALRMRLTEEGDRFELVLEPSADGRRARARFERRAAPRFQPVELASVELELAARPEHHVVFSNMDNALRLDFDGRRGALLHVYESNTAMWGVDSGFQHHLPRAAFGGDALRATFTHVRLSRDVTWVDFGRYGVDQPLTLNRHELFVLGDNSAESRDSREWGPAQLQWLIGQPRAVVWPPSSWRWLRPTGSASP